AYLDLEFSSVFALAVKFKPGAHGTCCRFVEKTSSVSRVCTAEPLGNEDFDRLAQQFLARVAKELLSLGIDEDDPAILVNNYDGIGSGFEQSAKFLLRLLAPRDIAGSGEYAQHVSFWILVH